MGNEPRSYQLIFAAGQSGITCMLCGFTSWHPQDVEERYCAACHVFHEEQALAVLDALGWPSPQE